MEGTNIENYNSCQECAALEKKLKFYHNELLDALDLKEGKGPTALSMLAEENQKLKADYHKLESTLAHANSKQIDLTEENQKLREALKVTKKSLDTYGKHPVIDNMIESLLHSTEQKSKPV